jgi:hypothetical protein
MQQLKNYNPHSPDIYFFSISSRKHLRRLIKQRSSDSPHFLIAWFRERRHFKVDQLQLAADDIVEYVLGFDVPMADPPRVKIHHSLQQGFGQLSCRLLAEPHLVEEFSQGGPFAQLEYYPTGRLLF